jgi:hypothetical protein
MLRGMKVRYLNYVSLYIMPSNNGAWNEITLSKVEKVSSGNGQVTQFEYNIGDKDWWHQIIWEDGSMKIHLEKLIIQRMVTVIFVGNFMTVKQIYICFSYKFR